MPLRRLLGNAGLSFLVKFSSGFWTIVDPTNGFLALRVIAAQQIDFTRLADRYFFEIDLLCSLGLQRRVIAELDMPAIYGTKKSSLSLTHTLITFPPLLLRRFIRRLFVNYLIVEINVGSLCGLLGFPLFVFALLFGAHEWSASMMTGTPRPTGAIILALLLFIVGFRLSLQALLYDVQFATRTLKVRCGKRSVEAHTAVPHSGEA